ncbi:hypothetical protein M758_11G087000 [Ceratodon purpureus]|uniref:Uncharacterized protein n=1 Tax=Ceratodon purpureus TaxID=3225 RepID=A0A8T0GD72_CERPU|nr:hypothetical protein KC19_11G090100 [Ceratodon purpureus]KAG0601144.1 hypothetical protein M758_11G087000 [Ceratodon purpureus]
MFCGLIISSSTGSPFLQFQRRFKCRCLRKLEFGDFFWSVKNMIALPGALENLLKGLFLRGRDIRSVLQ